jgi:hypothetical protein
MKLSFLSFILCFALNTVFGQNKPYISTEKAIGDIEYMIKTIEEVHYNPYFTVPKEQLRQNKEALIRSFDKDSIPLKQFVAVGMKIAAQMSGGHTAMDWRSPKILSELKTYQFIPFTGKLVDNNQYFLVTSSAIPAIKKGAFIQSVNGISIVELYKECMSYLGGIESYKNTSCEQRFPLYLFFTEKVSAPYSIGLTDSDKKVETPGMEIMEFTSFITQNEPKKNYTFEILEVGVGLISYNSCTNDKIFKGFLEKTFKTIKKKHISKLIIDIRENSGGNSSLNDRLLSYITKKAYRQSSGRYWKVSKQSKLAYQQNSYEKMSGKKFMKQYVESENQSVIESFNKELTRPRRPQNYFKGKTCFLIGPNTFSSANFLADAVKIYELSTLIGLATGEYTNDFGEQLNFTLPNSGNYIYVSSTYDIGANGNASLFEPVYPDIEVQEDILKFAIDWIKKEVK